MKDIRKNGFAKRRAYETVKGLIMGGELRPGQAVTEIGLSERLGISRTPIREVLHDLEQEGLIVTQNRRKRVYMLTVHEIEDIFDLKIEIESAVAGWAAERGTKGQFERLGRILSKMKRVSERRPRNEAGEKRRLDEWLDADRRLHELLFEMAGNARARQTIGNLNSQWHQLKLGMLALEDRIEKSAIEHERIVEAVCTRNAGRARRQMRSHLEKLKRELVKIMKLARYGAI